MLINSNSILCPKAFDIYTMASQAGINGQYHAAVAFQELLLKQFEKNVTTKVIHYNHFEENKITHLRAKYLLNVAKAQHDNALLNKGQYGKYHTCNSRPFSSKLEEKHFSEIPLNVTVILDRDTLFSYKPYDREERVLRERKQWTEPYDPLDVPDLFRVYIAAQKYQIDELCKGNQIRVNSFPK